MKIITKLLFLVLMLPFSTFANGVTGASPDNLNAITFIGGKAFSVSPYSDSSTLTNSFRLQRTFDGAKENSVTMNSARVELATRSEAPCNEYSEWIQADYSNLTVTSKTSGILFPTDDFGNKENLIDNNLDNYARWTTVLLGNSWIEVKDNDATGTEVYSAGTYAGFVLNDINLLSIGGSLSIETYLGTTKQETYSDGNLLSISLGSGKKRFGFVSSLPFDRVRLVAKAGLTVVTNVDVYYVQILKPCSPPELECNLPSPLAQADSANNTDGHAVIVENSRSGLEGVTVGTFLDAHNVVAPDTDSYMTMAVNVGIVGSASISIKDLDETFPAGHFAGFNISNSTALALDLLGNSQVRTYLDGQLQESSSTNGALIGVPLLDSTDRYNVGFVTTLPFDEIRYTLSQPVSLSLGATRIYYSVAKKYCAGPELECNTETTLNSPEYPIDLNMQRTGIEGLVCAACSLSNPQNVIDNDENSYASIVLPVSVANTAGISVRNGYESYPQGTYVAFDVSNPNLLNVELLGGTTIELYKENELVQSGTGSAQLIAANTTILDGVNHGLIGMVSNVEFDEARFVIRNFANINVGTTNVYKMVVTKGCPGEFECQTSTALTTPDYSVVVEGSRTGIDSGVACVGCSITDPAKVLSDAENDLASINLVAGVVGSSGSISVRDLSLEYPAGTTAGFVVRDPNPVLEVGLLSGIRIRTYLNGDLQESKLGEGQLIDLNVLLPWLGSNSEKRAVGFITTLPFNEVRITYTTLLQAVDFLDVYYAFADGRFADGSGFDCNDYIALNARNDINQTIENVPVDGNVLTNDEGAGLVVKEATYLDANGDQQDLVFGTSTEIYDAYNTKAGEIIFNADGTYSFTPEEGYTGSVPLGYTAEDENGLIDAASLSIKVVAAIILNENNSPIANNDNVITDKTVPVNGHVLGNDSDPDGDALTVTNMNIDGVDYPVESGNGALVTIPGKGSLLINTDGDFTFTPEQDFIGELDPITYTIEDGNGGVDTAYLNIKVTDKAGINSTYANDDANLALSGEEMSGNLLYNDFDPQGDNQLLTGATVYFGGTAYPMTLGTSTTVSGVGEITLNTDGTYSFNSEDEFEGTLLVVYSIKDENNNNRPDFGTETTSSATLYLTSIADKEAAVGCIEIFPGGEWDESISKAEADQLDPPVLTYDALTVAGTNAGMFFDIYRLDNSFNLSINGTPIANQEIQFDSGTPAAPSNNIRFLDGDLYKYDTPSIWQIVGTSEKPMLRVEVSPQGEVTLYGSKVSGGELYELKLYNGAQFNTVIWHEDANNEIKVSQDAYGWTKLHGKVYGESICATGLYEITKIGSFDNTSPAQVGDMITYTITVENVANEDISEVVVMDPLLGGELSGYVESGANDGILNIGETWTYTAEYPITSEDITNEGVYNQATVFGKDANGNAIPTKKSYDPDGESGPDPDRTNFTFTPLSGEDNCVVQYPVDSEDPFYWHVTGPLKQRISNEGILMGTNGGFIFDIYRLDNSFNMNINGTDLATEEIEFYQSSLTSGINVQFMDGDKYQIDTPNIKSLMGDQEHPMLRIMVSADGAVRLFGSKVSYGPLFELEMIGGASFNTIPWNQSQENDLIVSQYIHYTTIMDGFGYSVQNNCETFTFEKTGQFNDENDDQEAQVGETITYTFSVNNTGDIAFYDPAIYDSVLGGYISTDSLTGDDNGNGILDVDETWVYTAEYEITEDDIIKGGVYNQAELSANDVNGFPANTVLSKDPGNTSLDPLRPDHTFVKLVGEDCIGTIKVNDVDYTAEGNYRVTGESTTHEMSVRASNAGYIFDIYKLDNSFNMNINGTALATQEIEFRSRLTSGINVQFKDGDKYEVDTPGIKSLKGDAENPMLRLIINADGEASLWGSKENFGPLFELELIDGNTFNTLPWYNDDENTIVISQHLLYITYLEGAGYVVMDQCDEDYTPYKPDGEIGLEDDATIYAAKYYPNPVNTTLYVEANTQIETIEIYNLLGQRVVNLTPNSKDAKIDMEFLQANVYMMKVTFNGKTETYRVVKE